MAFVLIFHHAANARQVAADALQQAGHRVVITDDANQAWRCVQEAPPDLVITDFPAFLDEPRPAGALTLTEAIRATPELDDMPVLNLPSYSPPQFTEYAARAGVTETLAIPTIPQRLAEAVRRLTTAE